MYPVRTIAYAAHTLCYLGCGVYTMHPVSTLAGKLQISNRQPGPCLEGLLGGQGGPG